MEITKSLLVRNLASISATLFLTCTCLHAQQGPSFNRAEFVEQDQFAIKTLQSSFDRATGLWGKQGWRHDANSLTALVDFSRATDTKEYLPEIERTFTANSEKHWGLRFYTCDPLSTTILHHRCQPNLWSCRQSTS